MRLVAVLLVAVLMGGAPAWAENRALVIGNADYAEAPDLAGSDTAALARALSQSGFSTRHGVDLKAADLRRVLGVMARPDDRPGTRLLVLNGRFLHDAGETWFMGSDARRPGPLVAGVQGVPLSVLIRMIAAQGHNTVLILGTDNQPMQHQAGLKNGIGDLVAPPGVGIIAGTPEAGAGALARLIGGSSLAEAANDPALRLLPGSLADMVPIPTGAARRSADPLTSDRAAWSEAAARDEAAGYRAYLDRYPAGNYAAAAQERLAQLQSADAPPPTMQTRPAPNLSQSQRRAVQHHLFRLGYEPGVADGVFGTRSRNAIAQWQAANGQPPDGQLTAAQVQMLERQVAALDDPDGRLDRSWWQQTGARGGEANLRAYLRRYPQGHQSEPARRALAALAGGSPTARQDDAATWRWARQQGTKAAYQTYLERFPQGGHADEARAQIQLLSPATEAARREEAALSLNPSTRLLIERRLQLAGMNPGEPDGEFTEETRAALRRYQASRNLRVTGYITQQTMTSLIADVIR